LRYPPPSAPDLGPLLQPAQASRRQPSTLELVSRRTLGVTAEQLKIMIFSREDEARLRRSAPRSNQRRPREEREQRAHNVEPTTLREARLEFVEHAPVAPIRQQLHHQPPHQTIAEAQDGIADSPGKVTMSSWA